MLKAIYLLAALITLGCQSKSSVDYVLFSGQIENPAGSELKIENSNFSQTIPIREDGSFSDTLRIAEGYYTFRHRERTALYIKPGDDIHMTINIEAFDETAAYSGQGGANCNFLSQKYMIEETLIGDYEVFFAQNEDAILSQLESMEIAKIGLMESMDDLSEEFKSNERKGIYYEKLVLLNRYKETHARFSKLDEYVPSQKIMEPLSGINYDNLNDYKKFGAYRNLVNGFYINYQLITQNPETVLSTLDEISKLESDQIKNDLLGTISRFGMSPSFVKMDEVYASIMKISTDEALKKEVTLTYEKLKNLVAGKPAPKFTYQDTEGNSVGLENLLGKTIYIDVWATWCGPCIREIPALKKLEEDYAVRNIHFLSVSIDRQEDYDKWKKMILEKELGGMQLFADLDWQSSIIKDYGIKGIPRFMLIDADGNIINVDAPRPSSEEIRRVLDELASISS
ncbi:MAG: TlpA family protein disulfide reductase [Reichenbachiella sp.]